jgi:hypothetical protein
MTTRDSAIVNFLSDCKVARTSTIAEIFFPSPHACYKRLQVLYKNKKVKRTRDFVSCEYVYHYKKNLPQQLTHSLLVTDFYRELHRKCEVLSFKIEPVMDNIRPDAVFGYKFHGKPYMGLLEVEISNKGFNSGKYEKFYSSGDYKKFLPVMPTIFVVGNKEKIKLPKDSKVNYNVIDLEFNEFRLYV